MLVVVNYHYVAERRDAAPRAVFPITTDELAAQVDALARDFEFVTRDDLVQAIRDSRSLPERACLLTFDDGLREQVELALPVLEQRGVPGLFFACGAPLREARVLYVHKVHMLREHMDDAELLEALGIDGPRVEAVVTSEAAAMYRYDTREAAAVKYLLNVVLGPGDPDPVDAAFAAHFDERAVAASLYATAEHISDLEGRGALGAHGYSHRPLATLGSSEIRDDLIRGADVIEAISGSRPVVVSYPYGTEAAVSALVAREARASGFVAGMTLERAFNATLDDPLLLARLDTNDAPRGKAPLFSVVDGKIVTDERLSTSRIRYREEAAA